SIPARRRHPISKPWAKRCAPACARAPVSCSIGRSSGWGYRDLDSQSRGSSGRPFGGARGQSCLRPRLRRSLAGRSLRDDRDRRAASARHAMEPPYVVKPVNEGSSVGVFIIRKGDNRPPGELGSESWTLGESVMVEEFVPGRELTVAVMGERALGVTEIVPHT